MKYECAVSQSADCNKSHESSASNRWGRSCRSTCLIAKVLAGRVFGGTHVETCRITGVTGITTVAALTAAVHLASFAESHSRRIRRWLRWTGGVTKVQTRVIAGVAQTETVRIAGVTCLSTVSTITLACNHAGLAFHDSCRSVCWQQRWNLGGF